MKLKIEQRISELLKYNDCVIITGLGGFILNHRSAYLNQITNTIYPPSKRIGFNQKLSSNDGLLANYLSQVEKISYDEACLEILKFSRKANLKLKRSESILFENIGELYWHNNAIEFKENIKFNFNIDSYGLKPFQLSKKDSKNLKANQNIISVAAVVIFLICISVFSLTKNNLQDLLAFNLSPLKTNHYTPRLITNQNDSLGKETPGIYNV